VIARAGRWLALLAALGFVGFAGWAGWKVAAGKTTPPRFVREAAERAVANLRQARGERWAPNAARSAERQLRAALAEHQRQQAQTFFFQRDYDPVRRMLKTAEDAARQALRVARDERERTRAAAQQAIDRAGETLEVAESVAEVVPVGSYERMLLRKSQMAILEARILYYRDEFPVAEQRASLAGLQAGRVSDRAARVAARFTDPDAIRRWRRMINETVEWSRRNSLPAVVVSKEAHTLTLYDDGRPARSYRVELGYNSVRDKQHAGDNATPEGRYMITAKKAAGASRYYKALLLNYPNDEDRAQFQRLRRTGDLPRWATPGGLIEIHGEGGRGRDWTNGCVAMPNRDIDDLFARVGVGTPVTIVGTDGNGGAFSEVVRIRNLYNSRVN
jgi:lipoprotein-anchoring transpeptidase ErfK/SrfK